MGWARYDRYDRDDRAGSRRMSQQVGRSTRWLAALTFLTLILLGLVVAACGSPEPAADVSVAMTITRGGALVGSIRAEPRDVQPAGGARLGVGSGGRSVARAARPDQPAGRPGRALAGRALDGGRRWAVGRAHPAARRHVCRRRPVHCGGRRLLVRGRLRRDAGQPAGRRAPDRRRAARGEPGRRAHGRRHLPRRPSVRACGC